MSPARQYAKHRRTCLGFTLVELMVGLLVGLVSTLAITQILLASEGQKRTTVSGSDAQVSGILAMDTLRNSIQMAGYGYANLKQTVGCPLDAQFNGAAIAGFPANLVPVVITDGASDAPDSIRVLASSKSTFSVPLNVIGLGYVPGAAPLGTAFPVMSAGGVSANDFLITYKDSASHCQVFQATNVATGQIGRITDAHWNADAFPNLTVPANSFLLNMGTFEDVRYSVSDAGTLQFNRLQIAADFTPSYSGNVNLYSNIVNLQAYYGKASTFDVASNTPGPITDWNTTQPATNTDWLKTLAIRVALVSRSDQYEKEVVTSADPLWDVGANSSITGASTCGTSKCITLKIPRAAGSTDWQHYRYKVFDSVIPMRNMLWSQ